MLFRSLKDGNVLSVKQFLHLLKKNDTFITVVNESIIDIPYSAIYYEGCPMNDLDRSYFYVAVKTDFGKIKADYSKFNQHFKDPTIDIVSFKSHSGNTMISPYPDKNYTDYLHLKMFCQKADKNLIFKFWKKIGKKTIKMLKEHPVVWMKTHGFAVHYLHFRIQKSSTLYVTKELNEIDSAYKLYCESFA